MENSVWQCFSSLDPTSFSEFFDFSAPIIAPIKAPILPPFFSPGILFPIIPPIIPPLITSPELTLSLCSVIGTVTDLQIS